MVLLKSLATILTGAAAAAAATPNTLNVTVIGAQDNKSTLECWALEPGFVESSQAGTAGSAALNLGPFNGNASYSILPANFDGGKHNAPALQYIISTPLSHPYFPLLAQ